MSEKKPEQYLSAIAQESMHAREQFVREHGAHLVAGAELLARTFKSGGKVLICGNGGSAADAQHLAAELVGRLQVERRGLPAIALTTDSSNLTALANDYGFDRVFARQVQALARSGDLVIGISTSGKSPNVLLAIEEAKRIGCKTITLTGGDGGKLKGMADIGLNVSAGRGSSRIQETHIFAIHALVELFDTCFLDR